MEQDGFEWDETKRGLNLKKHGIEFKDILAIFEAPMVTHLDLRENYGEDRWIGYGLRGDVVIVVAFTEREGGKIRIISARKADKYESKAYFEKIGH